MPTPELQLQIAALELHLNSLTDRFDAALKADAAFAEAKKIYHELRLLSKKLDELKEQNKSLRTASET